VKTTLLLWVGLLALVLSGCQSQKTSTGTDAAQPSVNVGVGVAAAGDSATRFELWLLAHQPDQTSVPTIPPGKIVEDLVKDLKVPALLAGVGMPEWQAHILWSWDDMGPMEPAVQKEIARLDGKYTMNSYSACAWPGNGIVGRIGRACVMQSYACYSARNKMDERTLDIAVATQLYDDAAAQSVRNAGATVVADFLRTSKYCK
jgi:hypothetical protein